MIIGLCGSARSGKDTFYEISREILSERGIESKRVAFADKLKEECSDLLVKNTGISPFTTCSKEKEIIRPLLVSYGTHIRRKLDENCWIDAIKKKVLDLTKKNVIVFITDVRYPNELEWVNDLSGKSVFISRYGTADANEEERKNNKKLNALCDFEISWHTVGKENLKPLFPIVEETLNKILCSTAKSYQKSKKTKTW